MYPLERVPTILLATEKPFTKETMSEIKDIIEKSCNDFKLLEKYKARTYGLSKRRRCFNRPQ